MIIEMYKGQLMLRPENSAEQAQIHVIEKELQRDKVKHDVQRQWVILSISIDIVKEENK